MWSRWWCGGGSLRQRVYAIINVSHGYGEKVQPFDPPLLGLRDFAVECGGGRRVGGVASLSVVVVNQFKRGVYSSTFVSSPGGGGNSNNSIGNGGVSNGIKDSSISFSEVKKLIKLVNVESFKMKLGMDGKEVISYCELLEACESMDIAKNPKEAAAFAKVLDEAGVILLFRDKVYLHPDKGMDLVRRAVPLALTAENDPMREELKMLKLKMKKEEIDVLQQKLMLCFLLPGIGFCVLTVSFFFRLTFWIWTGV